MATFQQLTDATVGVSAHAWSPDGNEIAFAPNSNELRIADAKTLETRHSLKEHDMLISAIDWHPQSNYIVTCAHDRNAFVWSFDDQEKKWKPSLVILRIERAALDCRWSRDGQKFAVASSAKCVPVCYYESDNNWCVLRVLMYTFVYIYTYLCVQRGAATACGSWLRPSYAIDDVCVCYIHIIFFISQVGLEDDKEAQVVGALAASPVGAFPSIRLVSGSDGRGWSLFRF